MILYDECIDALLRSYMSLRASGTPSDAIRTLLNGQAQGWLDEGLTEPSTASHVVDSFQQVLVLIEPTTRILDGTYIRLDRIPYD